MVGKGVNRGSTTPAVDWRVLAVYNTLVLIIPSRSVFCTVEPQYNKPLYNEVLDYNKQLFFFTPVIVKYVEKTRDIMKPCHSEQIFFF